MSLLPTQFKKPLLTSEGKSKSTWGDKPKRVGGERDYANYDICSKVQLQQRKDNCLTLKWKTGHQRIPILTTVHLSLWIEWAAVEDICKIRFFFFYYYNFAQWNGTIKIQAIPVNKRWLLCHDLVLTNQSILYSELQGRALLI